MKRSERAVTAILGVGVLAAGSLLLSGCMQIGTAPESGPALEISTQYAPSTGPRTGFNTFEVYLRNRGLKPINFTSIRLDNAELKMPKAADAAKGQPLVSLSIDGMPVPLNPPRMNDSAVATWWQFYPTAKTAPGQTAIFQVNFRAPVTAQHRLALVDSLGGTNEVVVPRFHMPAKLIRAVTYTLDYKRIFVQYASHGIPASQLRINGRLVHFTRLSPSDAGLPEMMALDAPFPIQQGTPLHVAVGFADGDRRDAMVKAFSGITLDTPPDATPSRSQRRELALDSGPGADMIVYDVTCADLRTEEGHSAGAVVRERLKLEAREPGRLSAIGYCTATYSDSWNIYGPMADAVYAKPYRLGWGTRRERFIEEEEDCMEKARLTAAPRPVFWIPERFEHDGRGLEPEEMETLAWMSLVRGGKGIRYHFWKNPGPDPFAACPRILPAMGPLDQAIRAKAAELAPLAMVSERTLGDETHGSVKVYTAWAGDYGLVVLVRNLNYRVDLKPADKAGTPGFMASLKRNVKVPVAIPEWCRGKDAVDFVTGAPIEVQRDGSASVFNIDTLGAYKILWVANERNNQHTGMVSAESR